MKRPLARHVVLAILPFVALPAGADGYTCQGTTPDWQLDFDEVQARFAFPAPTDMDVVLRTLAEGLEWPRAYTMIGDRDTAIVLLEQETCSETAPYRVHILTQRGQSAIFLTGCCTAAE